MIEAEENVPIVVDAHLDIGYNAVVLKRDLRLPLDELRERERKTPPPDPSVGTAMVTWPALLKGRVAVIGGSLFVEPRSKSHPRVTQTYRSPDEAHSQALEQLDYYRRVSDEEAFVQLLERESDLDGVLSSWDTDDPTVGVFIAMEGADPIRDPGELRQWVEWGVRSIGLTWSAGTRYAGGNANPGLLTDVGEALLHAMADYHLMLDISHLWEDAAFQVLDRYPGPVVATHANPRALVDTPRQLSDDTIRRIAEREGVIGVVAFNRMLDPNWRKDDPRLSLDRMAEAVDHICQITGAADFVGLGSDLDGGFGQDSVPNEIDSVAHLASLGDFLKARGYSNADLIAILSGNWLRVMRTVLSAM